VSHLVYTSIGPGDNVSLSSPAAIPPYQGEAPPPAKLSQPLLVSTPALHTADRFQLSQSAVAGSDQEAVDFVNQCKEFLYGETAVRNDLIKSWLEKLNEFTMRSAVEVSIFWQISVLEI
jgi:hypothetical protein